jgi:hypothetical protein
VRLLPQATPGFGVLAIVVGIRHNLRRLSPSRRDCPIAIVVIDSRDTRKGPDMTTVDIDLGGYQVPAQAHAHLGRRRMLDEIDFDDIYYYIKPTEGQAKDWDMVPSPSRRPTRSSASPRPSASTSPASPRSTSPRSSTTATVRTSRKQGVLFCDMDTALREYPDLVKEYFGTVIPPNDNKFAALNSACGRVARSSTCRPASRCREPLQAYFRINAENMGQFERTLIIADEGAKVHYIEGCSAPVYTQRLAALGRGRDRREAEGGPLSATPPSRTGRTTCTTWSPSGRGPTKNATWSGSTATSARSSR